MYKHFKLLAMSVLVCSLVLTVNSMDSNIDNSQNNIDIENYSDYLCDNKQAIYSPYLIDNVMPTEQDMFQPLNIKGLDINDEKIQKCFDYLQKYDTQNCILLDTLLKTIYELAQNISIGEICPHNINEQMKRD